MPGLNASLFSATQALAAHSKGLEVAGKNLANINNPAYARQRVILGDRGMIRSAGQVLGMGVEARGLQQIRDALSDRRVSREISITASLEAAREILENAQTALGQRLNRAEDSSTVSSGGGGASAGIADALADFFNAFDGLAASPADIGEKQLLLQKAATLVERINTSDARLARVQGDATEQVAIDVSRTNDLLGAVAHLNELIGRAENGNPRSAIDLRDERQAKIEELARFLDFESREVPGSNGQVEITVRDAGGGTVTLVDRGAVTGPIHFDGNGFSGGSAMAPLEFSQGALQAAVAVRDGAVQSARDGISALAAQLAEAVNTAYNPTGATGNFFATPGSGLLALETGLTPATLKTTDTPNAGANELAVAVARIANRTFSTAAGDEIDGTPSGHFSSVVSGLGHQLSSVSSNLEDQQLNQQAVTAMRDGVSGVSMDEELTDMMQYQRSFQASARYLNVVDSLLELVVTRLGVL